MNHGVGSSGQQVPLRRVNGAMLPGLLQKYISMIGTVDSVDKSGRSFKMKSPDNLMIIVRMKDMLGEPIDGLIEVEGTVAGQNAIDCHFYSTLGRPSVGGNAPPAFDVNAYNEAVQLAAKYPQYYLTQEI